MNHLMQTDRRSFLKGVSLGAGATVLGPVLAQLEAHAAGSTAALPRRVVFVVESNGLFPDHIQPRTLARPKNGADRLIDEPIKNHELPDPIAPLAPFRDRITILQGLSGRIGISDHSANYGALGAHPANKGAMAQTIDNALGDALGGIHPHVCLGIHDKPEVTVHYSLSAVAAGKPAPIQCRPELAYKGLFGSVAGGEGRQAFDLRTGLLDYMADDVKRVRGALAGEERSKLDSYLEAFESLRDRQARIDGIRAALVKHAPAPDKFKSNVETDRLAGQFDIAAAALISGLTNCVTLTSGGGGQHYITYTGLGLPIGGHGIGHGGGVNGKTAAECRVIIRKFHAELIAGLAKKLDSVKEGDGTMLDRTLIVYMSDSGEQHHCNLREWPVLLLGNLGGAIKGGRAIEWPKYGAKGHRTMANLYLALLQAAGKPRAKFGVPDPALRDLDQGGPLTELL